MDKSLKDQYAEERKYYLGRTKTVPGTNKTVDEVRKEHQAEMDRVAAEEDAQRQAFLASQKSTEDAKVRTTAVTFGITRDVKVPATGDVAENTPEPSQRPLADPVYTEDDLKKLSKEELVTIAGNRHLTLAPDSSNKADYIQAILTAQPQ